MYYVDVRGFWGPYSTLFIGFRDIHYPQISTRHMEDFVLCWSFFSCAWHSIAIGLKVSRRRAPLVSHCLF